MDWKLLEKNRMYDGHFKVDQLVLQHDSYRGSPLNDVRREIVGRQNAVAVVPYDPVYNTVVLIEQFRAGAVYSSNPWLVEIVAGLIDEGESADEVARRETQEETGCEAKRLKKISEFYTSPGGVTEHMTMYIAEVDSAQVTAIAGLKDEHEDIQVQVVSVQQLGRMLDEGEIRSATPMVGLQWLLLHLNDIRSEWKTSE